MAEKKAKKEIKTIEIKAPRTPKFNLSMEDQAENTRIVLALQSLKVNAGWIFLMQIFAENKRILSEMIIKKKDVDGKPITEVQADEARYKHAYLEELMGKPNEFLQKLAPHKDPKPDTVYDEGQDKPK